MIITDKDGVEHEVFARKSGQVVDLIVRATDAETFEQAAIQAGLRIVEEGDSVRNGRGVEIDHIGPVMLIPGDEGNEPVVDNRHHVNIRLTGEALETIVESGELQWKAACLQWMSYGQDDTETNADEQGKVLLGVALIDPDTIRSPSRVWL